MKTIAFDLMGNDNGVKAGVEAALEFSQKNLDFRFILVGDKREISKITRETERITIIDVKNEILHTNNIRSARKENNSMSVAIKLVKENKAQAVISSGNSGVYLTSLTLLLKRIEGVKRPAFMPLMPTIIQHKKILLLDAGANLETTAEMLEQWALLGNAFSKSVLKVQNPKVAVINIGLEDNKGPKISQEVHQKLKTNHKLNYIGFYEPRNLFQGEIDVAVIDGYAGNMILKSVEGAVLSLLALLKKNLKKRFLTKIGALLSKKAFKDTSKAMDYRNIGAAWVLGVNGLAVKCHGNSDKKAFLGALNGIAQAFESDALEAFKEGLK